VDFLLLVYHKVFPRLSCTELPCSPERFCTGALGFPGLWHTIKLLCVGLTVYLMEELRKAVSTILVEVMVLGRAGFISQGGL